MPSPQSIVYLGAPIRVPGSGRDESGLSRTELAAVTQAEYRVPATLGPPCLDTNSAGAAPAILPASHVDESGPILSQEAPPESAFAIDAGPATEGRSVRILRSPPAVAPSGRLPVASGDLVEQALRYADPWEWGCLWQPECVAGGRFYADAEYLLWWTKGDRLPPLVTTSPPELNGILGPGTTILFGGDRLDPRDRSGTRFTAGFQFGSCMECCGIEVGGFFLSPRSVRFAATSNGDVVLARPFFDVNTMMPFSQVIAGPGQGKGSVAAEDTGRLWGLEANLRCNVCRDCWYRVDLLIGGRYLDLSEHLNILEAVQEAGGTQAAVSDRFGTRNQFAGPQFGVATLYQRGQFFLDLRGKVAIGDSSQIVDIGGNQLVVRPGTMPGSATTFTGGLLALPTNIGTFRRGTLSVVPELGINLGYQFTPRIKAYAGYSVLYWTRVLRPGDQIDLNLDQALIPNFNPNPLMPTGLHRPAIPFRESDYWAQGFNFGLEISY
jgi:hypothetical protein